MDEAKQMKALTKFRNEIEEAYSDIADTAETNLKSNELSYFPSDMVSTYKKDCATLEKQYDKCDNLFDELFDNGLNASNVTRTEAALARFELLLKVLDASNAIFTAFSDSRVASLSAGAFELFGLIVASQQKLVIDLSNRITTIEADLKKAKRDVTGAKVQKNLNLALTAIAACAPPLRAAQTFYFVLGMAATRVGADAVLGPTGPSIASGAKTTATEYGGIAKSIGKVGGTLVSVYSTVDTLVSDNNELGKAEKNVKNLRKKLKDTIAAHKKLEANMRSSDRTLIAQCLKFEKAMKEAHKAKSRAKAAKLKRLNLKKLIL